MRRLVAFNQVTLDGYFTGANGDLSWAHKAKQDAEWKSFVAGNASGSGVLVFGRVTYDLMVSYWPTQQAMTNDPAVAEGMNNRPKIVLSRTLSKPAWNNTAVLQDAVPEIGKMKQEPGENMAILGSGSIVSQLTQARLIDEYQIVVNPTILGTGRSLFDGVRDQLSLKLTKTRAFGNGNVLLCYEPME